MPLWAYSLEIVADEVDECENERRKEKGAGEGATLAQRSRRQVTERVSFLLQLKRPPNVARLSASSASSTERHCSSLKQHSLLLILHTDICFECRAENADIVEKA